MILINGLYLTWQLMAERLPEAALFGVLLIMIFTGIIVCGLIIALRVASENRTRDYPIGSSGNATVIIQKLDESDQFEIL